MKVLLVSNHYGRLPGGAVAMTRTTEQLLEETGHSTVAFAIAEDATFPTTARPHFPSVQQLRRQPLPSDRTGASPYSFPARDRLRRLVTEERPDVAHLHNVFSKLTLSVLDGLDEHRIPVVMTLHDFKSVCPNGLLFTHDGICHRCVRGGRFGHAMRHRCVDRSVYRSAIAAGEAYVNRFRNVWERIDAFIAPSEFLRDAVVAGGLPRDRIEVVPNPAPVAADLRAREVDPRPTFVYSGRLIPQKGLDVLLDAAAILGRDVRIAVYGSGPLETHLRRRVENEDLAVEICGYADRTAIAPELDRCLASLTPSVWYENCPMAILEAAGRGVATVASDLGGIQELVAHKESGLLVPPGDPHSLASALRELADDPAWAVELGRGAWDTARERHDRRAHVEALTKLYRGAIDRRRSRV